MKRWWYWLLSFFRKPPLAVIAQVTKTGQQGKGTPVKELLKRAKADTSKEGPSILKYNDHPFSLVQLNQLIRSRK